MLVARKGTVGCNLESSHLRSMTHEDPLPSLEGVYERARERVKNTRTGVSVDLSRIDSTVVPCS